nr:hypothetical protein [Tanacetum cinerariifolium]
MRKSPAYKTYLAYATGAITPKKARKFKKPASPSKKKTLVAVEEPTKKPTKKPAARRRSASVQIRDTPGGAQLKKAIKQSKQETNIHQAGGSSKGAGLEPKVPDDQKGKSTDTSERTGLKPGVLDVSKADSYESDQVKDDAQATIIAAQATQNTKVSLPSSSMSSDYATKFLNFDNFPSVDTKIISMIHIKVQHEDPSIQTSPLLTIPVLRHTAEIIKKHSVRADVVALYHALMESILEDEDAMDKGVADKLKKKKPDDADKDKGPPARSNQGLKRKNTSNHAKPSKKSKSTETSKGTTKS